nr:DUF4270 domain-containing protein [Parabacteroides goldsteinii]
MKIKPLLIGLGLGITILSGCSDDLNLVGSTIQPGGDKMPVYVDTFQMQATTLLMDSVYARTTSGLLGEFYDPLYGNVKSDYICQFYCPSDFKFQKEPINGQIDSVDFKIIYYSGSWVGDSLTPMRAQIYQVDKQLERDFYTNFDPAEYCDMQNSLGMQTYTAHDNSVPDSVRYHKKNDEYTYVPTVTIRMPREFGQKFYDETINNPGTFSSQENFNKFFPGLYVTNTYGSGNILQISYSSISIYYKYNLKGSQNQDSTAYASETFNVTKEVLQLNRFKNTDLTPLLQPDDSIAYLKTPAGVYTQLTIPAKDIAERIDDRIINNIPLTIKALPQENWQWALTAPANLLLLPKDSLATFFVNNKIEDSKTAFRAEYSSSNRSYNFDNISNLMQEHIKNNPEKDMVLLLVPVDRVVGQSQNYYGQTTYYTAALNNYLLPSGVKLLKTQDAMKIVVTTTDYK